MKAVVVPVGVTRESTEGVLRELLPVDLVVAVTVPGYEDVKRPILDVLRGLSEMVGALYREVVVVPGSVDGFLEVYRVLLEYRPDEVYLVGVTGSRYLQAPLVAVLLKYWRDTSARVYLLHGIEGEVYHVEPLQGFCAAAMKLTGLQRRILEIVYSGGERVSGRLLKERYGFGHSVYAVLRDMERKGLLVVRRGRIEWTFPGKLLYELLSLTKGAGERGR